MQDCRGQLGIPAPGPGALTKTHCARAPAEAPGHGAAAETPKHSVFPRACRDSADPDMEPSREVLLAGPQADCRISGILRTSG